MFCYKCGSKVIDGAEFCQKCGSKVIKDKTENNTSADIQSNAVREQGTAVVGAVPVSGNSINNSNEKPAKKKSKKRFFIIGAIILVIVIIIAASVVSSEMDYIKTVKTYMPFANSQGLPYTCEEVFGKYIESAVWESSGDGDTRNVKISGTIKGTDTDAVITIKAAPDPNYSEMAIMSPVSVKIKDDTTTDKNEAADILYIFFAAYDEGMEDLSELKAEMTDLNVLLNSIADAKSRDNSVSTQNAVTSDDDISVRNAYIQKVQELAAENSDFKFGLIDLISNNAYALVADLPGYYVNVYVYDNGNVKPIMEEWGYGAGGNQGYQYLPGKNIILNTTLGGAGREVYETYMCVDSNNKVVNVYDYDLCSSYPSSYYYGDTEISEYEYSCYQVHGEYNEITGNLSADDMISTLNGGTDIRSSVSGEILFNGRTVESLLNVPINSVIAQFGEPLDSYFGDEYNHYCSYEGIYFGLIDYADMIGSISFSPEKCSIDGNTLNKSRDELVKIISKPAAEEWRVEYSYDVQNDAYYEKDIYCIDYDDYTDSYSLSIIMYSPDEYPNEIHIMSK